ncbi:unnamed protein product [Leuciscus chuanchicus]
MSTSGSKISIAPVPVPEGSAVDAGDVTAWETTSSSCSDFCNWVENECRIGSLTADSDTQLQPVESTTASPKDSEKKSPAEVHTRGRRRSTIHAFSRRAWKLIKQTFPRFRRTRMMTPTPQSTPHQSDPDPSSVPGPSECEPNNGSLYTFYEVKNILGSGSFSRVFKGIRKSDEQEIASTKLTSFSWLIALKGIVGFTKRLMGPIIRDCSRLLATEVAMMLLLRRPPVTPYVIEMYEWFDRPDFISLVLEFPQPCKVLRYVITDCFRLNEEIARGLMRQLVLAVQHCIDHGVFHNDIHVDNILVNTHSMELKLIDFGLAHLVDGNGYNSAAYLGAKDYCPPEVFTQLKYHAVPTNVWALGIVLNSMVKGRLPCFNPRDIVNACPDWNPDLSNASNILRQHRPFLRFAFEGQAYQYAVLPFGLALSPRVFTKVVEAALFPLRQHGVRILIYLDDWLILAHSRDQVCEHRDLVLRHLARLGLRVNQEKRNFAPCRGSLFSI